MMTVQLDEPGKFSVREDERPKRGKGEALVRVHRVGVCGTDIHAFGGHQPFFSYPRVLGHEAAVEVVEVDANERGIKAGDRCAVRPYLNCGTCIACKLGRSNCCEKLNVLGVHSDGLMRPWWVVPVDKLHASATLTLDQLAIVEPLSIGCHAIARAQVTPGERALVIGAGPIGLGVVMFAQAAGAHVVVSDISDERLAFCREHFGVTETVNPRTEQLREPCTVIFDVTGNKKSMEHCFELAPNAGRIVFVGIVIDPITYKGPDLHRKELTLLGSRNALPADFDRILPMMERGEIDVSPWITHRMSLAEVPQRFGPVLKEPGLLKAMIEVEEE